MKKAQSALLGFVLVVCILLGSLTFIYLNKSKSAPANREQMTLFYSLTCPHCRNIEEYIANNSLDAKYIIVNKEVSQNQMNLQEMANLQKGCGIQSDSLEVPFIYYKGKCYVGEDEILALFEGG